jgi:hypothetical protein
MGPNTRKASFATAGKATNVAAIKASEELHRDRIPASDIMAGIAKRSSSESGRKSSWFTAVLKSEATQTPRMK